MKKLTAKIITNFCFIIFVLSSSISKGDSPTTIKNHPLKNQITATPEYFMATKNLKTNEIDLLSFSDISSGSRYKYNQYEVVEIIPPNTKFRVVEVYESVPKLFSGSYKFAVLEKDKKLYTKAPIQKDEVFFKYLTHCDKKHPSICNYYISTLEKCLSDFGGKNCTVSYELNLLDNKGGRIFYEKLRPPYPDGFLNKTQSAFINYQKSRPNLEIIPNKDHPTISAQLTALELINTYLYYEDLNIAGVGILSFGKDGSWEQFKKFNKSISANSK